MDHFTNSALQFKQSHATVMISSGIYTASLSSFVIGFAMIVIVVSCRRCGVDPDNIAAPLTATFSDFITLIMLVSFFSVSLPHVKQEQLSDLPKIRSSKFLDFMIE